MLWTEFFILMEYTGDAEGRRNGALISMENGKAVAFAIFNLQARGEMLLHTTTLLRRV